MSASPRLSIASRVDSSGTALRTRRLTLGLFLQYGSYASTTSSTPGVNETNRYGPAPTGAFLKPSSPTCSTYFLGTIHPTLEAVVPKYVRKSGQGCLRWNRTRPEHELIDEAVLRHRPRFGQARRAEAGWHRLHQRVVEGVEHHERDDGPFRVRGVEPAGGQGNVRSPCHASFGRRAERSG